jgi:nucleotide-binding universal stress UspA family protein
MIGADAMIKTILVPVGGGDADEAVFETALTVARPLLAHLEFLHVHVRPGEAAHHTPHVDFARGTALRNALQSLNDAAATRAAKAARHVSEFCARWKIDMVDEPRASQAVTARWRQEEGDALQRLLLHARHNDLAIMARAAKSDGLPADRLETLLLQCGRPLLIVPAKHPLARLDTAMVCWKETPDAARAVSAAMPLLTNARRVVVVGVEEGCAQAPGALDAVVDQLAWHGIDAESQALTRDGRPTIEVLVASARERKADLMVMGGYGHGHAREALFGGCTQAVIQAADIPVLLVH